LPEQEWKLAMPTPVVGEILSGFPFGNQKRAAEVISQTFKILNLDFEAAEVVGKLALSALKNRGKNTPRQAVKVDVEIVACAIRWNAGGLCFLDGDHQRIVEKSGQDLEVGAPSKFLPKQQKML